MASPFALSVSQRAGEGEEGARAGPAGQLHKRQMVWRVMDPAALSATRLSFTPSECRCPHGNGHPTAPAFIESFAYGIGGASFFLLLC